jgi:hypothetical protein
MRHAQADYDLVARFADGLCGSDQSGFGGCGVGRGVDKRVGALGHWAACDVAHLMSF